MACSRENGATWNAYDFVEPFQDCINAAEFPLKFQSDATRTTEHLRAPLILEPGTAMSSAIRSITFTHRSRNRAHPVQFQEYASCPGFRLIGCAAAIRVSAFWLRCARLGDCTLLRRH